MDIRRLADLHCDTLTAMSEEALCGDTLDLPGAALTLHNVPQGVEWLQFYAVFTPERYRGEAAAAYYEKNRRNFLRQTEKYANLVRQCETAEEIRAAWQQGKRAAVLTVENASVLAGDLSRVELLRSHGVRVMSLTWNAKNELASGHDTEEGLSAFGRQAVAEMERVGITADVSHLNDRGFREFLEVARRPFMATHSNARAVCGHRRNLTDAQIDEMVRRGCLIGLNYYVDFLADGADDDPEGATAEDLYRHICHFLERGAGDCLALGSDYDGCTLPAFLSTPERVLSFADLLLERGIGEEQIRKIYWGNALRFIENNF